MLCMIKVRLTLIKLSQECLLCLHDFLNKRSELFCKCRHENKYLLKNFKVNDKG